MDITVLEPSSDGKENVLPQVFSKFVAVTKSIVRRWVEY